MSDHTRFYLLGAFAFGVALTTACIKWPEIQQKVVRKNGQQDHQSTKSRSDYDNQSNGKIKRASQASNSMKDRAGTIREGIEGCIGDTPLIKIKSLSEYTGCEILVKAEVLF
jgi:cysteine synthase